MKLLTLCIAVLTMTSFLNADPPATAPLIKIVLVGDSTVATGNGWGDGFKTMLRPGVQCENFAKNGRSSKSFRDEGHWDKAVKSGGTYMLIQFGHNDQPGKGPERETDPATTFPANLKRYVEEARAAGMRPILVTSLTRRKFDANGKIKNDLADYVEATRRAAAEANAPLLDLNRLSIEYCEAIGEAGCELLSPKDKEGKIDRTHLNAKGSDAFGKIVAKELAKILPELASAVEVK
jgi:pectinesterase